MVAKSVWRCVVDACLLYHFRVGHWGMFLGFLGFLGFLVLLGFVGFLVFLAPLRFL